MAIKRTYLSLARWLPIFCTAGLMALVAFVSVQMLSQLREATGWRQHTMQVILAAQTFEENLLDAQRGMRGYITFGDTNALAAFEASKKLSPEQLNHLFDLTSDNPVQQQRLKKLSEVMQKLFDYDLRTIDFYRQHGTEAVLQTDLNGEGRAHVSDAREILKRFSQNEKILLDKRDTAEQSSYRDAQNLLIGASVLSAVIVILADLLIRRELNFRRRAEEKLSHALTLQNAIFNSADYAIVTTNVHGIVQTFNPAAARMLGYTPEEIIGHATPMLWRDPIEVADRAAQLSQRLGRAVPPDSTAIFTKVQLGEVDEAEWTFIRKDGERFPVLLVITALADARGRFTGYLGMFRDISKRKALEVEREKLIRDLQFALAEVKTLSGLIPICGWCKNVRNDKGYWSSVEHYVRDHTEATFTHGICPGCQEKFKADIARANAKKSGA